MNDFDKSFYTIPEAAELLKVHENTIYNMVRKKQIEHYKIGSQIRIASAELARLKVVAEQPTERKKPGRKPRPKTSN